MRFNENAATVRVAMNAGATEAEQAQRARSDFWRAVGIGVTVSVISNFIITTLWRRQ